MSDESVPPLKCAACGLPFTVIADDGVPIVFVSWSNGDPDPRRWHFWCPVAGTVSAEAADVAMAFHVTQAHPVLAEQP